MFPTQCPHLLAAIIEQCVYEFTLYIWQIPYLQKLEMGISVVVGIGDGCPYGHYSGV